MDGIESSASLTLRSQTTSRNQLRREEVAVAQAAQQRFKGISQAIEGRSAERQTTLSPKQY
jgi:hypothetical protein